MKFIRDLLGKKRKQESARLAAGVESLEQSYRDTIGSIVKEADALKATAEVAASNALTDGMCR